ncbi:amidohydrolase [Dialister histaminiformans]|uniref:Amidohydrolase n=1 Tax=Allisonella histaminiformans TaxID=209880 RepID=A0A1G5UTW6_9FIRM|nr:amidohydrolase [Allisonella histaminiformans]PWL46905.1 MAG: amidohydrolase [Veillonellaceae bacterium]SDA37019.1 amidohydrolase [Allisonella histaminiformans]
MNIDQIVNQAEPELIALRRHFHEYPELSQQEFNTLDFIKQKLESWGISCTQVPQGGIFGVLDSGKPGITVLMRADVDALPVEENKENLSTARCCISRNKGVMHACGHDGHMAMLLTEAHILASHKEEWDGKIIFMFEQAEEMGKRGIVPLMNYLADNHIHVDTCFGTHVLWGLPAGKVAILDGAAMAGAFFFKVKIHGQGGHGSRPDQACSPIEAFISFAAEIRNYRMLHVDPAHNLTFSLGMVQAGDTPNVIPSELTFAGTARVLDNEDGLKFRKAFFERLNDFCSLYGCSAEILTDQYYPVTVNYTPCVTLARRAISSAFGNSCMDNAILPWMASETFSATESLYPGVFFFTGIQNLEKGCGAPHHTDRFDIDEKGLTAGVKCALAYILALLREKPDFKGFTPGDRKSILQLM